MREIGITGGIGSGKSYVARIFQDMGYAVYDADKQAKSLYTRNPKVKSQVISAFGPEIYLPNGQIDRARLASIVFSDRKELDRLNAIVHPATREDYREWKGQKLAKGYQLPLIFREAAILFEAGAQQGLDGVITVYAPKKLRLERVQKRDASSRGEILARMSKQWPDHEKRRRADFVIYNDSLHDPTAQAKAAIEYFSR